MARLFTVASDETLTAMISRAAERLVIVAPGLSLAVAAALVERLTNGKVLSEVSITLDTDPEICRLGYGVAEVNQAFDKVAETFAPEIVCTFKGVRYETIVDDKEFRKRIAKHFGEREFTKLFSEYDASRAEDLQLV